VVAVLEPLFATAWLIDDFLRQAGDFGAATLLLSSASSKTARAAHGVRPWVAIEHRRGADAMREAYLEVLEGRADASRGLMLSF
jgi:hypothetical protein